MYFFWLTAPWDQPKFGDSATRPVLLRFFASRRVCVACRWLSFRQVSLVVVLFLVPLCSAVLSALQQRETRSIWRPGRRRARCGPDHTTHDQTRARTQAERPAQAGGAAGSKLTASAEKPSSDGVSETVFHELFVGELTLVVGMRTQIARSVHSRISSSLIDLFACSAPFSVPLPFFPPPFTPTHQPWLKNSNSTTTMITRADTHSRSMMLDRRSNRWRSRKRATSISAWTRRRPRWEAEAWSNDCALRATWRRQKACSSRVQLQVAVAARRARLVRKQ